MKLWWGGAAGRGRKDDKAQRMRPNKLQTCFPSSSGDAPKQHIFPKHSKRTAQSFRVLNLQRINCCTFARSLPNRICKCKPQSSLRSARFLSYGLCQHTCRCALRHERQANAALTRADQQLRAAWTDQEGIRLTQIHRAVRDTVVFTANTRQV